jgi:tyrosyl-tRNA synthetase
VNLRKRVAEGANPRDIKFELGLELVARFHGDAAAQQAQASFVKRFRGGEMPEDIEEFCLESTDGVLGIADILRSAGLVASNSEAFRMIQQGAVKVDGARITDRALVIDSGREHIFQVGKRKFARVTVV